MRVWDVHPGYLSRGNLLGQHAEIHALASILVEGKKGYRDHPETLRWKDHLPCLARRHDLTVTEMALRGYRHFSSCPVAEKEHQGPGKGCPGFVDHPAEQFELLRVKYRERQAEGRIPLPARGSQFWAHHKYSVMARGYGYYKEIQAYLKNNPDLPVREEKELVERVLKILEYPAPLGDMVNVMHHLWGYFKREACEEEKEFYLKKSCEDPHLLLDRFYGMACKYRKSYLLHSTIFADLLESV